MEFINIGKIVNTHGIKGELRILSSFRHKDKVFIKDFKLYIQTNMGERLSELAKVCDNIYDDLQSYYSKEDTKK